MRTTGGQLEQKVRIWSLVALIGTPVFGCTGTVGGLSEEGDIVVGPTGGELILDGAKLTIPPGAVLQSTQVRCELQDIAAPSGFHSYSKRLSCAPNLSCVKNMCDLL